MLLKQSTAFTRVFALSAISLTVQIKISKNGAALANPAAGASNLTEVGQGLYKFALGTADVGTLGSLSYALTDAATGLTIYTSPDCQDNVVLDLPGASVASVGTGGIAAASFAAGAINAAAIADAAIDLATFASDTGMSVLAAFNLAVTTGTAQAGAAGTITLASGAVATNDYYKDQVIFIQSGTGAGQTNRISSYVGSTKVATLETTWKTNPDNTSVYVVLGRVG